jgi:hypothetical protein
VNQKMVIEVEGPSHYLLDLGSGNGNTHDSISSHANATVSGGQRSQSHGNIDGDSGSANNGSASNGFNSPMSLTKNGASRFNHRVYESLGWTVVDVPYYEWRRLREGSNQRNIRGDTEGNINKREGSKEKEYLKGKIMEVVRRRSAT